MKYSIEGTPLPVVICTLGQNESMITEKGGMSWMSPTMEMSTNMEGGFGKAIGRFFSGESMFLNRYTCKSNEGIVAFSSGMPGQILPFEISPSRSIIAQKTAFLAAESSVELSVFFNKSLGGGLFGGEGFVMQKLSGQGTAFVEIDGHCVEYDLAAGQQLIVDTGHLAAMEDTVTLNVQMVKGVKNMFFGGEGFFNTCLTGPGRIWIQTMPIKGLAEQIIPFIPKPK